MLKNRAIIKKNRLRFKIFDNISRLRKKNLFLNEDKINKELNHILKKIKESKKAHEFKIYEKNKTIDKLYFNLSSRKIGEGYFGLIYNGFLKFKNKNRKRVAIKFFKIKISDRDVLIYNEILKKVSEIKLKTGKNIIPKIGFIKIKLLDNYEPIWVQVSSAFIKKENGVFVSKFFKNNELFYSKKTIKEVETIYRKINDLGLDTYDLISQFRENDSVVPIDLDILFNSYINRRKITSKKEITDYKLNMLLDSFARISNKMSFNSIGGSRKILVELCKEYIKEKPELKNQVEKIINDKKVLDEYICNHF